MLVAGACSLTACAARDAAIPMRIPLSGALAAPPEYRLARSWLQKKRAEQPTSVAGWEVTARFVDERTGHAQSGRGALAVRPPEALRLQIVGPAGRLALDVWLGPSGGRLSSPMVGLTERTNPGEHRAGRPTGFLAWWMLHRFQGRVLAVERAGTEQHVIVRAPSGELVTFVREASDGDTHVRAIRKTAEDEERVAHDGSFCGHSQYTSARARVTVDVRCGEPTPEPRARAFEDPDRLP